MRTAAIVTVGSELTAGLRVDTNTAEIARALTARGFDVAEAASFSDDVTRLSRALERLIEECEIVVVTGGLGPTHDDITRGAAARALGLTLTTDERLVALLEPARMRHADPQAAQQVLVQAQVIAGARVIDPSTGTAPGLVMATPNGLLALLPGPPTEMRPMLEDVLEQLGPAVAVPRELGVTGMTESDVQVRVSRVIEGVAGLGFTVLARPGDVRVILSDQGCGGGLLNSVADEVSRALGDAVYSVTGESLAATVVRSAAERGLSIGCAESCTGGLVCAALTEVPGASEVVRGAVVAYDNTVKAEVLGVDYPLLAQFGAVSAECAAAMAQGAREILDADVTVAVTGIAGPTGGTADKPVGFVWFAVAGPGGASTVSRAFPRASRQAVRERATAFALDLLRQVVQGR